MPRKNTGPRIMWRKDVSRYVIRWYEGGTKRERATGTDDYQRAVEALSAYLAEQPIASGPSRADQLQIADVLTMYLRDRQGHVADIERLAYAASPLIAWWGERTVDAIRGNTCRAYTAARVKAGRKESTARKELSTLQAAINHAHREGTLIEPRAVTLPPKPPAKERWLTRSEAARMLWAARVSPHAVTFIRIALETGARHRAILGLRFVENVQGGWIDLERRQIHFNPAGRRQTKKRRTGVPISESLARHLAHVRNVNRSYAIEWKGDPVASVRKTIAAAVRRAGIDHMTPHTFRHTAITWACQRGLDPFKVTGYFGVSMEVLQSTYLHHHPDHLRSVVQRGSGTGSGT